MYLFLEELDEPHEVVLILTALSFQVLLEDTVALSADGLISAGGSGSSKYQNNCIKAFSKKNYAQPCTVTFEYS